MDKLLWRNLRMQLISKSASRSWTHTKIFLYLLISLQNKNESGWRANSPFLEFKHLSRHRWWCKTEGWAATPWWRDTGNKMEINSMVFSINENTPVFYKPSLFLLWKSPGHFCTDSVLVWPQHFPGAATWEHSKQRPGGGSDWGSPTLTLLLSLNFFEVVLLVNDSVMWQQWKAHPQVPQGTRMDKSHVIAANYISNDKSEKDLR